MVDKECPAEPVVGDKGKDRGGFAKAAEHLNDLFPVRRRPISRQLVHKWWLFRHSNGFPEAIEKTDGNGNGGKGRPVFDLDAITDWYVRYCDTRLVHGAKPLPPQQTTTRATNDGGEDTLAA